MAVGTVPGLPLSRMVPDGLGVTDAAGWALTLADQAFAPGSVPVGSATYAVPGSGVVWVATSGSDTTGTGTSGEPYATIKKGLAQATAGQTVVVRAGTYHEGGIYPSLGNGPVVTAADVTLQAAAGEAVWLDGSSVLTGWTADSTSVPGKTVWRAPLALTMNRAPTQTRGETVSGYGSFLVAEYPIAHWPEQCFYDGAPLTQVATLAELGPGKFFVEGASGPATNDWSSTGYVIGDSPSGHEVRVSDLCRALGNGQTGFTLRGIGIRRYAPALCDWGAVSLAGSTAGSAKSGLLVENVVFEDLSNLALKVQIADATLRRVTMRRIGQEGVGTTYADRLMIEHCLFEECNRAVYNYGPDAGAIKVARSEDLTIRHSWVKSTRGHGIWLDECVVNSVIHHNRITDSWGRGILVEISDTALIVGNLIERCGVGSPVATRPAHDGNALWVSGSNRVHAWNNTLVDCETAARWVQDTRAPDTSSFGQDPRRTTAWLLANCSWRITEGSWGNNAFVWTRGISAVYSAFLSHGQTNGKVDVDGNVLSAAGNVYIRRSATQPTRFAMAYPDGAIKVYPNRTYTGAGLYDPALSWDAEFGETGSALTTNAAPWLDETKLRLTDALIASATPGTPPAGVAALLALCPWTTQPVGAGYLT